MQINHLITIKLLRERKDVTFRYRTGYFYRSEPSRSKTASGKQCWSRRMYADCALG